MFSNPTSYAGHVRRPSQPRGVSPLRRRQPRLGVSVSPVKASRRRPFTSEPRSLPDVRQDGRPGITLPHSAAPGEGSARKCLLFLGVLFVLMVLLLLRAWTSAEADEPPRVVPHLDVTLPGQPSDILLPPAVSSREGDCWVYMHTNNNGDLGEDVRSILLDHWRDEDLLFDVVQWRKGDEYAADHMASRWKFAHGGCTEALRRHGDGTCKWFTLFRHPIARLVSAFHHCQGNPGDPACASDGRWFGDMDLVQFAEHWGNYALRQFALAGVPSDVVKEWATSAGRNTKLSSWYLLKEYLSRDKRVGEAPEAALDGVLGPVQGLLQARYAAIGIAEEPESIIKLFESAPAMPGLDWQRELQKFEPNERGNFEIAESTRGDTFREAMDDPRIEYIMRLDISLYEHAVKEFRQQKARYGVEQSDPWQQFAAMPLLSICSAPRRS